MLIVMHHTATDEQVQAVTDAVVAMGLIAEPIPGSLRTAIGVLGNQGYVDDTTIRELPGVREVIHVSKPYKLVSRDFHPESSVVEAGGVKFGDGQPPVLIAGPCTVESEAQMLAAARLVKENGAQMLRGGAFKPRTGPHSFQGLGIEGLKYLRQAGDAEGLPVITEVMRIEQLEIDLPLCGCPAGRCPQHAELRSAQGGWQDRSPGPAQARHECHHRGISLRGRIYPR